MSRLAFSCASIMVVGALAASAVVGGGGARARAAQPCTPYTAIMAPGTWETHPDADPTVPVGMLRPIGDGLQRRLGDDITVLYAPYAASAFDQGFTYAQSLRTLETELDRMASGLCASTRVILAGYSQGADGIGDFATRIGNGEGPIDADRVVGVGLLADPHRDPNTTLSLGDPQPGHGIAGTRGQGFGALTDRVRTLCVEGDLYCSLNAAASPFLAALGKILSGDASPIASVIPITTDAPTLLNQAVKMGAGWTTVAANLPPILAGLTTLPTLIGAGDFTEAHRIVTELDDALAPLVTAAEGVDLPLIASVIRAAAAVDPSGWTAAESVIADIMTRIDIVSIAANAGRLQETLWHAVESASGQDPLAAAGQLGALAQSGLALAGSVIGPFTAAVRGNLRTAVQAIVSLAGPDHIDDLVRLSTQSVTLANFYASNVHVDYGDDAQILLNYLGSQVGS
ncbi:cutinase family protein [Nocardia yunnanensis]|uniref:Cutinase family protein n=1 Tax=Nocardia yunnanensis TaxID=2382165 RepID=A0A386ZI70_9NOCA|nr:cutinase family protein [Nocardia yunnanensis]AYF76903.1 cutinase family protein [Nocardia yunnanensis]